MSIFRDKSVSSLLSPRAFIFSKDEEGIVYVQDNNCFLITKEEAKLLIDGVKKYIELVDENEIIDHNDELHYRYEMQLRGRR